MYSCCIRLNGSNACVTFRPFPDQSNGNIIDDLRKLNLGTINLIGSENVGPSHDVAVDSYYNLVCSVTKYKYARGFRSK